MGVDAMEIGVQIRKFVVFSKRTCYRSVRNHPFLVGFVCYLIFLYRSSPSVFSLLVSASPVLVCTAVLLGTLLSFGQQNIPESEKDEKVVTYEIASLKTGVVEDNAVVKGDENVSFATIERCVGKGRDIADNDLNEPILVESRGIGIQEDGVLVDYMQFIDVNSREILREKQVIEKVERESDDLLELENKEVHEEKPRIEGNLIDGEVIDNQDSNNEIENLEVEDDKYHEEIIEALKKDQLGSASGSSLIYALKEDQLGSAPGSSFIDALKKDQMVSAPGSSLIDAIKEDHFASASGSSLIMEDQLGSTRGFSWRLIEEDYGQVDGADGDESLDSGSDGAESSSPDASVADVMLMLDELHPLLELEVPQTGHTSHDGSDAGSERLHESDDESLDFEEYTDNQVEEGESEDDNDEDVGEEGEGEEDYDDEEEEEGETAKGEKEDESKSVIKWTEVDQKNLMDLGTLELERNRHLENHIARRRAHKNMRLMAEKNLIDLENYDLPFSFLPIATTRQNPFELPDDTYDDMAFPGSAPSILLPSQNPFDVPYDSNEEKPDLKINSFQQEFSEIQHKQTVYRRNETFSVGPSIFGGSRHERQDFDWRPYFVPERFSSEEVIGFPLFKGQSSEVSESKFSSVRDSESVDSAVDEEDKKSHEQLLEPLSLEGICNATLQQQISEISESKVSNVPDTESVCSVVDEEDKKLNEQDDSRETKVISNKDCGANHVECGIKSSGEVDFVDTELAKNRDVFHDEAVITLGDVENHQENELRFFRTESTTSPQEPKENESHLKTEPGEEYSSRSSYSSLSEVDDNIPDVTKEEYLTTLEQKENVYEESGVSTHSLPEEMEFMSEVVEHREPVYDSSPTGMERFLSFTSISSDTQLELSEMTSLPVLLEASEKESEVYCEDTENDSSGFEDTCASPSQDHAVDDKESILREVTFTEASELDVKEVRSSVDNPNFGGEKESVVSSFSSDIAPSEEYTVYPGEHFLPDKNKVVSSSHDSETLVGSPQNLDEKLHFVAPSADSSLPAREGQMPSMVLQHVLVQPSVSSSETEIMEKQDDVNLSSLSDMQLVEEGVTNKDRDMQHDAYQVLSSIFDADIHDDDHNDGGQEHDPPFLTEQVPMVYLSLSSSETDCVKGLSSNNKETHQLEEVQSSSLEKNDSGLHEDTDVNVVSTHFGYEDVPSVEKSSSELEKQLSWSDKTPSYNEPQEAPPNPIESIKELNVGNNDYANEDHNHDKKTLKNSSPLTSGSTSTPFESPQSRSPGGEEVNMVKHGNAFEIHDDEHKTLTNSSTLPSDSGSTTPFESPEDQSPGERM